jgi:hypothetical protein
MHQAAIAAGLLREAGAAARAEAAARAAEPAVAAAPEGRATGAMKWRGRVRARQLRSRPRDA